MDEERDLLTDHELCDKLRISLQSLHRHLLEGREYLQKIKCLKIGNSRRWNRQSVEEFINMEEKK